MPEQTLGGIPLGLGMVMKINFLNFHVIIAMHAYRECIHMYMYMCTANETNHFKCTNVHVD